uniref:Secreted protein n=1 Tax=Arundo donax TaxID=35708 RepID=A0A0A9E000_ARUDO
MVNVWIAAAAAAVLVRAGSELDGVLPDSGVRSEQERHSVEFLCTRLRERSNTFAFFFCRLGCWGSQAAVASKNIVAPLPSRLCLALGYKDAMVAISMAEEYLVILYLFIFTFLYYVFSLWYWDCFFRFAFFFLFHVCFLTF